MSRRVPFTDPQPLMDTVRVGLIIQAVTRCGTHTRVAVTDDIEALYRIHPTQDVLLFTHPHTQERHARALLGVAEIIQTHTGASDALTLEALAAIADQYTFTPRHREETAA